MDKIYISVIIPIYDSEKYLKKCLDSIVNQTLQEIEIILINDGSTDNSSKIMKEYSEIDKRIILIDKENGGVSSARNNGLELANGEYITFVDSDDWCELTMLDEMYKIATINSVDFISSGYIVESFTGKCIRNITTNKQMIGKNNDNISNILSNIELGYSVGKLYKRSILNKNNIRFDESISFAEDAIFIREYILNINSIAEVGEANYHYVRANMESLSTKYVVNMDFVMKKYWNVNERVYNKFLLYGNKMRSRGNIREIDGVILLLYNNYRVNSCKKRKERIEEIKILLKDKEIHRAISNFKPIRNNQKLLKALWKTNNPYFIDSIYKIKPLIEKFILKIIYR